MSALSAGMLIYAACVEMLAGDFVLDPHLWRTSVRRQALALGSLLLGVVAMGAVGYVSVICFDFNVKLIAPVCKNLGRVNNTSSPSLGVLSFPFGSHVSYVPGHYIVAKLGFYLQHCTLIIARNRCAADMRIDQCICIRSQSITS